MNLKENLQKIKAKHGVEGVGRFLASPLARIAQEFSSGGRLSPGDFSPFAQMDSKTIGFMGIQYLTDHLSKYDFPMAPTVGYRGLKHAKMAEDNSVRDAMAIFGVKVMSASGINVEFEIPLSLRNGGFMEPAVMLVENAPRIICQAEIDNLVKSCTFEEPMDIRGGMYAPPLEREVRDNLMALRDEVGPMPHRNRGMWFVGQRDPMMEAEEDTQNVVDLWRAGKSEQEISQELGLGPDLINEILKDYRDIPGRKEGQAESPLSLQEGDKVEYDGGIWEIVRVGDPLVLLVNEAGEQISVHQDEIPHREARRAQHGDLEEKGVQIARAIIDELGRGKPPQDYFSVFTDREDSLTQGLSEEEVWKLEIGVIREISRSSPGPGAVVRKVENLRRAQALSGEQIDQVINLRQQGMELDDIAELLDIDYETVADIWADYAGEMGREGRSNKTAQEFGEPGPEYEGEEPSKQLLPPNMSSNLNELQQKRENIKSEIMRLTQGTMGYNVEGQPMKSLKNPKVVELYKQLEPIESQLQDIKSKYDIPEEPAPVYTETDNSAEESYAQTHGGAPPSIGGPPRIVGDPRRPRSLPAEDEVAIDNQNEMDPDSDITIDVPLDTSLPRPPGFEPPERLEMMSAPQVVQMRGLPEGAAPWAYKPEDLVTPPTPQQVYDQAIEHRMKTLPPETPPPGSAAPATSEEPTVTQEQAIEYTKHPEKAPEKFYLPPEEVKRQPMVEGEVPPPAAPAQPDIPGVRPAPSPAPPPVSQPESPPPPTYGAPVSSSPSDIFQPPQRSTPAGPFAPQAPAIQETPPRGGSRTAGNGLKAPDPALSPYKGKDISTGTRVETTKGKTVRSRGGGQYHVSKGSTGEVVADIFGDGSRFRVRVDRGGTVDFKRSELKRIEKVSELLSEVERLVSRGAKTGDIVFHLIRRNASKDAISEVLDNAERLGII